MNKLTEEFQIHETLNEKLWNVTTKQLLPEVKDKVVEIVTFFEENVEVPIEIVDVQLCGSNASYNYTESSDLDVHIIANFEAVSTETELLQTVYDVKKSQFNKNYDVTVHGVEIELYVQDIKSTVVSNGIYSVCDDVWIKEPKPIKSATKHNTEKEVEKWKEHIFKAIEECNYEDILHLLDNLYLMRHNSIAVDGEYSVGNQIFKDLRSQGVVDKLKNAYIKSISDKLTLEDLKEHLTKGQLVSLLNEDIIKE